MPRKKKDVLASLNDIAHMSETITQLTHNRTSINNQGTQPIMTNGNNEVVAVEVEGGFSVNLADIKELTPIADGTYRAAITEAKPGKSAKGHGKFSIRWRIVDEDSEFNGRTIYDTWSFHPAAMWSTKDKLIAVGVPDDHDGPITSEHLIGEAADIRVEMTQSTGIDPKTQLQYPPRPTVVAVFAAGSQQSMAGLLG